MTIYEKLLEVQKELKPIAKDSTNPHFKNRYFDINSLLSEVKPVLTKHKLILTQGLTTVEGKWLPGHGHNPIEVRMGLATTIQDAESDGKVEFTCPLPECADAQKYGAAITYFRRYALTSLLALEAEDDDGNSAGKPKPAPSGGKETAALTEDDDI